MPLLINGLTGLKAKFRDAIANQNITLINNQANVISNIKDPLNNRLRPLYSVKNATVRVYADLINKTTNGTASLMTALTVSIAKQRVSFQQTLFPTVDAVLQQMTDFIKAMLARIRSTLTDSNMVIYKVSGCRDTATNSLNNVFIAFSNDMRACALSYNGNDTIYRAQIDQTYKDVYNSIFNQLVNITTCASINQLSDPNSIDATTNCTRTSFALCLALVSLLNPTEIR